MTTKPARFGLAATARLLLPLALATGLFVTAADIAGQGAASPPKPEPAPQGREPARQEGQEPIFRAATRIVPVLTTVTDAQGRLVPNLEKEDFTVLDNGKPVELALFLNETQPFTTVVMLDFSASMTGNLDRLKSATEQFLIRLLPDDKAQVGAFSDKIQFSGTFTNDRDDLIGSLRDLQYGNPTRRSDRRGRW